MSNYPHIYTYCGRLWKPYPMIQVSKLKRSDYERVYHRVDQILNDLMTAPAPAGWIDISCKPYWLSWEFERLAAMMAEKRYIEYLRDSGYEIDYGFDCEAELPSHPTPKRMRLQ